MDNRTTIPSKKEEKNKRNTRDTDFPLFRKRMLELRDDAVTHAAFFRKTGISDRNFSYWTTGKQDGKKIRYQVPSLATLIQIANALNVSVDYVLGITDFTKTDNAYIGECTGLDDNAIRELKRRNKQDAAANKRHASDVINALLRYDASTGILNELYNYLFLKTKISEEKEIPLKGNKIINMPINQKTLEAYCIYRLNNSLSEVKKKIHTVTKAPIKPKTRRKGKQGK